MSFDEGALAQPLALGFYACERGGLKVGHYLLVTGAGETKTERRGGLSTKSVLQVSVSVLKRNFFFVK